MCPIHFRIAKSAEWFSMNSEDSYTNLKHPSDLAGEILQWFSGALPQCCLKTSSLEHLETQRGLKVQARHAAGMLKGYEVSLTGLNDFAKQQNNRNPWHLLNQIRKTKYLSLPSWGWSFPPVTHQGLCSAGNHTEEHIVVWCSGT